MTQLVRSLFDESGFVPRWLCGNWSSELGWTHIASDLAIWSAYTIIPAVLIFLILRRRDIPFPRIFWLFAAFIFACGTVHLVDAIIYWHPIYRFQAFVKVVVASISWVSLVAAVRILPRAMTLPGIAKLNAELRAEIQQRRESEQMAAASLARLAAIVETAAEAIFGLDRDGKCSFCNPACVRMLGYNSAEELLGQDMHQMIHHTQRDGQEYPHDRCRIRETLSRREGVHVDNEVFWRKDGVPIPVEYWSYPIVRQDGEVDGTVVTFLDITGRRQVEDELRQAKDTAERANRIRGEFLANVSHELRTPMNAIIGMTQLALEEPLTPEVRGFIETANESAHSLLTLLNDILDFSKLESGKFRVEQEPFALRETVDETVRTLSNQAFEKGLELMYEVSPDCPDTLIGDAVRLRQVLTNLIGNALKFTEQGEVVLQVKQVRRWPGQSQLSFSVRDTGIGISREDQQRILEPFTQVDSSSTRRYTGTGLGLAISSELLRLMGARLSVESELGRGSLFSFQVSLPIDSTHRADVPLATQSLHGIAVLVVDDNETNRLLLREALEGWGMRAEMARDGAEAMGKIQRKADMGEPYPLVIVDALMPGMDGYTLSQQIHDQSSVSPPVVLMVSSADRRQFRDREAQTCIAYYLEKPVSRASLLDSLLDALELRDRPQPNVVPFQPTNLPDNHRTLDILLAEDTPANQRVVTAVLNKRGHSVTLAKNGREAIERFTRGKFDVILMDIQMPILDGFQVTAAIRAMEEGQKQTPIIAMTAHAMSGDREKCLEAGMDTYLAKPIDVDTLLAMVETAGAQSVHNDGNDGRLDSSNMLKKSERSERIERPNIWGSTQDRGGEGCERSEEAGYERRDIESGETLIAVTSAAHATAESSVSCESLCVQDASRPTLGPFDEENASLNAPRTPREVSPLETGTHESIVSEQIAREPSNVEPQPPTNLVDLTSALRRLGNDMNLFRELAGFYQEDSPGLLKTIQEALDRGDSDSLTRAAHSLKGLASNFGAEPCVTVLAEIESLSRVGRLDDVRPLLPRATEQATRLSEALQPYRQ